MSCGGVELSDWRDANRCGHGRQVQLLRGGLRDFGRIVFGTRRLRLFVSVRLVAGAVEQNSVAEKNFAASTDGREIFRADNVRADFARRVAVGRTGVLRIHLSRRLVGGGLAVDCRARRISRLARKNFRAEIVRARRGDCRLRPRAQIFLPRAVSARRNLRLAESLQLLATEIFVGAVR